jgi:hypothetical protein
VKEARLKRLRSTGFQLYDIMEKAQRGERGKGGMERKEEVMFSTESYFK